MNNYYCYLIGYIDKETKKVTGVQLASEPGGCITHSIRVHPVTLFEMWGRSYQNASDRMVEFLNSESSYFKWLDTSSIDEVEERRSVLDEWNAPLRTNN